MSESWRFLLGVLLILVLAGCASAPAPQRIPVADTTHIVYFIYRDWHTSLMLDAATVAAYSQRLQYEAKGRQFVRIGWGDGDYFTGKNATWRGATKALVASGYSAVQLLTYNTSPFNQIPVETRVPLAITEEGMRNLIAYLDASLVVDEQQQLIPLPAYGEGVGQFYLAQGHYGLFSNCNTFSGRALQAAQLPIRTAFALTAQSVFQQAQRISQYQQAAGVLAPE